MAFIQKHSTRPRRQPTARRQVGPIPRNSQTLVTQLRNTSAQSATPRQTLPSLSPFLSSSLVPILQIPFVIGRIFLVFFLLHNFVVDFPTSRPHRSPVDRFLGQYPSLSSPQVSTAVVELNEADVCFSAVFSEPKPHHRRDAATESFDRRRYPNAGILAVLPSVGSSKGIVVSGVARKVLLALPLPTTAEREREREYSQSVPSGGRFPRSEPVRVPLSCVNQRRRRNSGVDNGYGDDDEDNGNSEEDEMLSQHKLMAWGSQRITCCSVMEGAGRTLKGRDLRQVRNSIWRQTGFLDSVE